MNVLTLPVKNQRIEIFTRATPGSSLFEYMLPTGEASCVTVSSARGTGGNVGVNFRNLQSKEEGEKEVCNDLFDLFDN